MSDTPQPKEPVFDINQFEQISRFVESEFSVEDKLVERGIPTFYVSVVEGSKDAFLRLVEKLDDMGFMPVLRRINERTVLRVVPKLPTRPNRLIINVILLVATIGTTFLSGYLLSLSSPRIPDPYVGALEFTVALLAILGAHEMGHKLTSDKHRVEATYPYFIPGIPPIGTFGAVIQQKSLSPNKDALFDLGASGPVIGFIVTVVVTIFGIILSLPLVPEAQLPSNTVALEVPMLFNLLEVALVKAPATSGSYSLLLHPVAFAGYVGMIVTMLNLLPTGMLDGGHTVRSLLGERARVVLTFFSIAVLFVFQYWLMLFFVLFLSIYKHPGPLDDVSKLSTRRKIVALLLVAIFVLCLTPLQTVF
jgi:membrane-associated protease RseP (regulator of RpoE activity)